MMNDINHNKNKRHSNQRERRRQYLTPTEEKRISSALQSVWRDKVVVNASKGTLPQQEQRLLDRLLGPFDTCCGISAGMLTFVALRGMRARVLPRLLFKTSASSPQPLFAVQQSPFQPSAWKRKQVFHPNPFQADLIGESSKWKRFDLFLDASASTCLGMTVYLHCRVQTLEQVAHLPLHSPAATQTICPILLHELLRWQRNLQQDKLLSTYNLVELYQQQDQDPTRDVYLRCLLQFAGHCETRSGAMEP